MPDPTPVPPLPPPGLTGLLLAVNAGSTSTKVSLLEAGRTLREDADLEAVLAERPAVAAVVHRVVHGGTRTSAERVDDDVVAQLTALTELAPLQQPPALAALARCRAAWPDVPHVACFDTSFHTTVPEAASTYALPARLRSLVRSYGFHGLSHAWSARRVAELAPAARRVVVAHLGGGASLCAVLDGRSVMTTMGFTPLDGLVMATRSGSLDPGALLWLAEHTDEDLPVVLEQESGLLGLCGTGDMREVLARTDDAARLALDVYVHRLVTQVGACAAALGGLDALVFTGGVGEHAAPVRARVAERLGWLGVGIGDGDGEEVTAPGAEVRTFVVHAREDLQMADEVARLLGA